MSAEEEDMEHQDLDERPPGDDDGLKDLEEQRRLLEKENEERQAKLQTLMEEEKAAKEIYEKGIKEFFLGYTNQQDEYRKKIIHKLRKIDLLQPYPKSL